MTIRRLAAAAAAIIMIISVFSCAKEEEEETTATTTSPLPEAKLVRSVTDGTFSYDVYDRYIEVTAYLGSGAVVVVPDDLDGIPIMSIGNSAFYANTVISDVILSDNVVNIANRAFARCENLANIKMNGVRAVGMHSFEGTAFTEIEMPDCLANLGKYAFSDSALVTAKMPGGLVKADEYIFSGCKSLTSVSFTDAVTEITSRMFSGCTSLREIIIPDTVNEIGDYAFADCTSLVSLTVPASVKKIGDGILSGCPDAVIVTPQNSVCAGYAEDNGLAQREP